MEIVDVNITYMPDIVLHIINVNAFYDMLKDGNTSREKSRKDQKRRWLMITVRLHQRWHLWSQQKLNQSFLSASAELKSDLCCIDLLLENLWKDLQCSQFIIFYGCILPLSIESCLMKGVFRWLHCNGCLIRWWNIRIKCRLCQVTLHHQCKE